MNGRISLILFIVFVCLLCFGAVYLFMQPALVRGFDLSKGGDIGSAIGGITSPITNLTAAILLFLTLRFQIQATTEQRRRNEHDLIFQMYAEFEKELDRFSTVRSVGPANGPKLEVRKLGLDGLNAFSQEFLSEVSEFPYGFKDYYETGKINILLLTFKMLLTRVKQSSLPLESRMYYLEKLRRVYKYSLAYPVSNLVKGIEAHPHIQDEYSQPVVNFWKDMTKEFRSKSE
jgi:hypothetical protein